MIDVARLSRDGGFAMISRRSLLLGAAVAPLAPAARAAGQPGAGVHRTGWLAERRRAAHPRRAARQGGAGRFLDLLLHQLPPDGPISEPLAGRIRRGGLQVIGIHTPEFGFERTRHNVADAVREFGIRYPVGQDNDFQTWRAWGNRAWPSFYLLDRDGRIVLLREGEGHARELEGAIRGFSACRRALSAGPATILTSRASAARRFISAPCTALRRTVPNRRARERPLRLCWHSQAEPVSTGWNLGRGQKPWCSARRTAA